MKLRVGSRESRLAVVQTQIVIDALRRAHPDAQIELVTMKTTGDKILDRTLDKVGGKGLFVKELDQALLEGRVDLTVHSLQGHAHGAGPQAAHCGRLPPGGPPGCPGAAPGGRKAWILPNPSAAPASGGRLQLEALFPGMQRASRCGATCSPGCKSWTQGQYGALVLACAGLKRLGLEGRIQPPLPHGGDAARRRPGHPGRTGPGGVRPVAAGRCPRPRRLCLRPVPSGPLSGALDGGCSSPVAAYARCAKGSRSWCAGLYVAPRWQLVHPVGPGRLSPKGRNWAASWPLP